MPRWIRFEHGGKSGFGTLEDDIITVHEGELFASPSASGETFSLADVTVLMPCVPKKMIALWNNFHALAKKLSMPEPEEPLYLIKTDNSYLASGQVIRRPKAYSGKVVYEGEIGIVIGKECKEVSEEDADDYIFGYTCINDVTAVELIDKDPTFAQWVRSKSFDTFGVFGPVIATGINPDNLSIKTVLNGQERQNYPVSDMILGPRLIVRRLSHDMTLHPGDVICCGTSLGVGSMKEPSNTIEVSIEGIGTLSNTFVQ